MKRGPVAQFTTEIPSLESYWRAIILFGQNVASYKFALGGALLELGKGPETVGPGGALASLRPSRRGSPPRT